MANNDSPERKPAIPFRRHAGHVTPFSIESEALILIAAIRHHLQDDFLRSARGLRYRVLFCISRPNDAGENKNAAPRSGVSIVRR